MRTYWRKVVVQEGVEGCNVAQEREVCEGWADDVMGARPVRVAGSVVWASGKRIGEMNGGQLSRDISARLSTTVLVLGHAREGG